MRPRRDDLSLRSMQETFTDLRSDYSGAKASRFRRRRNGLALSGSHADYHYRTEADFLRLLEYARDMDRNDCIVGQTVNRAVINTLQGGITLDTSTGDTGADLELWNRWKAWTEDSEECDLAGEHTFADIEQLVLRHMLVDGDVLALPLRTGQLQLTEAHRLRTPRNTKRNVVHGVLLNDVRRKLEFWITKEDVAPSATVSAVSSITPYAARDADGFKQVFHVLNATRVSQTRGVTAFAPIFDVLGMFEDIQFAKLVQAQIVSCFAVFRERAVGFNGPTGGPQGATNTETLADGSSRTIQGVAPGMEIAGAVGETLKGFSPAVPNAEYFEHVKLMLTLVGINLGLPLCLVLLDASETNFSGWRGAVDQARLGFRNNQRFLTQRLHRPTYLWKVRQWLADDAALRTAAGKSGVDIFGHTWNPPNWPYIEPMKDAAADLLRVRNVLTSPRRLHAERGRDWETIADETVQDNAYAIRLAKAEAAAINTEFTDSNPVHWRELISLPTPDGVQIALQANTAANSASEASNG